MRLPTVSYRSKTYFFDARLKQLRNVENPHDYLDLNDVESACVLAAVESGITRIDEDTMRPWP